MRKDSLRPVPVHPTGTVAIGAFSNAGGAGGVGNIWSRTLAVLPGIGTALVPKLTCPACWPAYAGLLSSFGLGFVNYSPYLLLLTILFLVLAAASLGWRAKDRRGYAPFVLGVVASIFVVIGKFVLYFEPAMYAGIGLLMGGSLWNSWPRRRPESGTCPACVPREAHAVPGTVHSKSDGEGGDDR